MSSIAIANAASTTLPTVNFRSHGRGGHGGHKQSSEMESQSVSSIGSVGQMPVGAAQGLLGNMLQSLQQSVGAQATAGTAAPTPTAAATGTSAPGTSAGNSAARGRKSRRGTGSERLYAFPIPSSAPGRGGRRGRRDSVHRHCFGGCGRRSIPGKPRLFAANPDSTSRIEWIHDSGDLQSRELLQHSGAGIERQRRFDRLDLGCRRHGIHSVLDGVAAEFPEQFIAEPANQWLADAELVGIQRQRQSLDAVRRAPRAGAAAAPAQWSISAPRLTSVSSPG